MSLMTNPKIRRFFDLRGVLPSKIRAANFLIGSGLILAVWLFLTEYGLVQKGILPSPLSILTSFPELHFEDALINNALYSLGLNLLGLAIAVIFAIPIGFPIGLFPIFRTVFERYISVIRYLPLTAVVGLFIVWFGIGWFMKVQFLAFSIFVYLLPIVIQRIDETDNVFIDTAKTLGATRWQRIKYVFWPDVISRLFDDIRVTSALSWTYIVVVEVVNAADGGIGALANTMARSSRIDKVFAILIVIILIGLLQDMFMKWLDKLMFAHKYIPGRERA